MNSKDWDNISFVNVRHALEDATYNLNEGYSVTHSHLQTIEDFISNVELLKEKQLKEANKNIPAILRK